MPHYRVCPKCKKFASSDLSHCVECGSLLEVKWFNFVVDEYLSHKPIKPADYTYKTGDDIWETGDDINVDNPSN